MNLLIKIALAYLLIINMTTFIMFAIDKWKAKHNKWRIPEATLLIMAVIGGCLGAICGMRVFHHKTFHKKFYIGLPIILLIQIVVVLYCLYYRIL